LPEAVQKPFCGPSARKIVSNNAPLAHQGFVEATASILSLRGDKHFPRFYTAGPKGDVMRDQPRLVGWRGSVVGSVKDLADQLEQWFVERACDGFVVAATHLPGAFEGFRPPGDPGTATLRLVITAITRASHCAKTSVSSCRSRAGGSSRRGNFCRQPGCSCKWEATDRAPADSTLLGRGKPNRSRRVFSS
jgi:hypothetical protein